MNKPWKNTFGQIHAEQELKEHTKEYLYEKVYRAHTRRASHFRRLAAASALCLFLFAAGAGYLFFTPVTYISVDINPSLELGLNCFERIISVESYNEDGKKLADSLELKYLDYQDALTLILEDDTIEALLDGDNILSLTVAGESESQNQEVLQDVEDSVAGYSNVHCHSGNIEEVHEAHSCGMSFGKYQAFQILQELDPSVTSGQVQELSMHEIWQRIRQLSGASTESDTEAEPDNTTSTESDTEAEPDNTTSTESDTEAEPDNTTSTESGTEAEPDNTTSTENGGSYQNSSPGHSEAEQHHHGQEHE